MKIMCIYHCFKFHKKKAKATKHSPVIKGFCLNDTVKEIVDKITYNGFAKYALKNSIFKSNFLPNYIGNFGRGAPKDHNSYIWRKAFQ